MKSSSSPDKVPLRRSARKRHTVGRGGLVGDVTAWCVTALSAGLDEPLLLSSLAASLGFNSLAQNATLQFAFDQGAPAGGFPNGDVSLVDGVCEFEITGSAFDPDLRFDLGLIEAQRTDNVTDAEYDTFISQIDLHKRATSGGAWVKLTTALTPVADSHRPTVRAISPRITRQ